jgi:serine/threonine protein kinase
MATAAAATAASTSGVWLPGREYDIRERIGEGEGRNSIVFKIALRPPRQGEFALKMIVHVVGEEPSQRFGHEQSTMLARGLGAEWREPMALPKHECLVPVLHHYHSDQPRLRDYVDPGLRQAVADRTLFLVMPLYQHGSLRKLLEQRKRAHAAAPFGLEWRWFGRQLLRMLRAVDHLISHNLVHGDIKDDQLFLDQHGQVVLGDFGTAWKLVDEDGIELRLRSRDELLDRRAGVGPFKAPELRGRCHARDAPLLRDVYAKAEGFSIGMVMYYALGCHYTDDVFARLCDTHLAEERRAEKGQPPSRPDDPTYGRKQPGWVYTTADLPSLPANMPEWLAEVVRGLVKSDHCEAERRLSPREAIQMLEVEGLARLGAENA